MDTIDRQEFESEPVRFGVAQDNITDELVQDVFRIFDECAGNEARDSKHWSQHVTAHDIREKNVREVKLGSAKNPFARLWIRTHSGGELSFEFYGQTFGLSESIQAEADEIMARFRVDVDAYLADSGVGVPLYDSGY